MSRARRVHSGWVSVPRLVKEALVMRRSWVVVKWAGMWIGSTLIDDIGEIRPSSGRAVQKQVVCSRDLSKKEY
jgi:hypothetical protein